MNGSSHQSQVVTLQGTQTFTLRATKGPSFSGKQSSHQTQRNNKKLTSSGFKQQPICTRLPQQENKIIYKTACSDGPNSGSGKPSQKPASLKRASPVMVAVMWEDIVLARNMCKINPPTMAQLVFVGLASADMSDCQ